MQLSISTDYAIRILMFLALFPPRRSAAEISVQMGISKPYVAKVMQKLKAAGWVDAFEGGHGGYRLVPPLREISLLKVITVMESTIKINRCLEEDRYCSRFATYHCPVRKCYEKLQGEIEAVFAGITLDQLVDQAGAGVQAYPRPGRRAGADGRGEVLPGPWADRDG